MFAVRRGRRWGVAFLMRGGMSLKEEEERFSAGMRLRRVRKS